MKINFVPSLPKLRAGKILRRLLKAQALGQDVGDLSTLETGALGGPFRKSEPFVHRVTSCDFVDGFVST